MADVNHWIRDELKKGRSPEEIKKSLINSGWNPVLIDELMSEAKPSKGFHFFRNKKVLIISILLVAIVGIFFIIGQSPKEGLKCSCPEPAWSWSKCTDEGIKTRANYRCGPETNYTCESYNEEMECLTEIKIKGSKELKAVITPSLDDVVKGTIKIEALSVPEKTEAVVFIIFPLDVQLSKDMPEEDYAKLIKLTDDNGSDGWSVLFDTITIKNGYYNVFVGPTYLDAPEENPWTDAGMSQVIVEN